MCCVAARAENIDLPHSHGAVVIDGVMDEASWQEAVQVELNYETDPGENLPARVKTVAYLMEDGKNLFVGFAASDPDPSTIRAYLRDRDTGFDDDIVGISIDTFNDSRRAFEFYTNPLGVQMDSILNEDRGGDFDYKIDSSWDAIWDSAGQINDDGYVVEMKIPLNQLRFPATDGVKTWGFEVFRGYPRSNHYWFASLQTDRNNSCFLCQIGDMSGFEGAEPGRDLEVVPTLTASRVDSTDEPGIEPLTSGETNAEAGLSLRWGITPDLTANLAINPDFSQVEADAAQLSVNNRFALFYSEKRPFFLEGADYFLTPFQAVFTRTIASPDIGAKLTGKRGKNTFGLIAAQDTVTNLLFPGVFGSDSTSLEQSNSAFVGRYSRGFGEGSSIGTLITVRDGDGYHNYVGGFDARWKINDQHTLSAQYLESETQYPMDVALDFDQPLDSFDGNASRVHYDFNSRNWFGNLKYVQLTEGFRADSGFEFRVGSERKSASFGRVWHGESGSWWNKVRWRAGYEIGHQEDGTFTDKDVSMRLGVGGPMQSWTQLMLGAGSERENGVLFDKKSVGLYAGLTPRSGLVLSVFAQSAERIDYDNTRLGDQVFIGPRVNWNISRSLLLAVRGSFVSMDTKEGEKIFDASVLDARLTWQFNVRSFLRMTLQRSATSRNTDVYDDDVDAESRDVGRQLLYSYKINPQTVFFLGYSDQYVDDDGLHGLTVSDRSVFMKIGYAWNL